MATEQRPAPPELKSVNRVANIPLVHDSISVICQTLSTYTPTVYAYGQAVGSTALNYSQPFQTTLAPLLVSADGFAMKGLDVAQERFPTPFVIKTEEIAEKIKTRRENAYSAIATPVSGLAHNVDASLSPIVDRFEIAVHKINGREASTGDDATSTSSSSSSTPEGTQVQRAYRLGIDLKDQIYALSSEQIKQLQSQNVYIQRAQESVKTLNSSLAAHYASAKDKSTEFVHEKRVAAQDAAQNILAELEKAQAATKKLPEQIQASLKPVQEGIQASVSDISTILKSEGPVSDKLSKVGKAVQENLQPLLQQASITVQEYIDQGKTYLTRAKSQAEATVDEAETEAEATVPMANGEVTETH